MFRRPNEHRIRRMWFILSCFDLYTQRKLYESCMFQEKKTYQEKENTADFLNFLFGGNVKASDLNDDDNDFANKALSLNNEFENLAQYHNLVGDDFTKEDLLASVNLIEYYPKLIWVKIHHLQYPQVLNIVIAYISNKISYPTFKKEMLRWHKMDFPISCNIRHMTRALLKAEPIILEMLEKRKKRKTNLKSKGFKSFHIDNQLIKQ